MSPSRTALVVCLVALLASGCKSEQLRAVERFNDIAGLVQVACLDSNSDGKVDVGDSNPPAFDVTGDGKVDELDAQVISDISFTLPQGKSQCDSSGRGPQPDWQVSPPPDVNCDAGERGVLLFAVGGGAVQLDKLDNAAGARWMVEELSGRLDVPAQIAAVAPGLKATANSQPDGEQWGYAYISERLRQQTCIKLVLLGHSHGGVYATGTAARLEQDGLGGQVLLTVAIDRTDWVYGGTELALPQSTPVLNIYIPNPGQDIAGQAIDQPNVDNVDATGLRAPERGEQGGALEPVNHVTIDNSEDVLKIVEQYVKTALAAN